MDTGNDPRFALVDAALKELKRNLETGRIKAQFPKQEATDAAQRAHSAMMTLRYSYVEPDQVRQMAEFGAMVDAVGEVETLLGGDGFADRIDRDPMAVAHAAWTIATVRGLGDRLDLANTGYEVAVDAAVGRVVSASPHPGADNLVVTRVAAGVPLRVVTNDTSVAPDDTVGVALLPPVDLRGVVSLGMFLGAGDGILKGVEAGAAGRPAVPDEAWNETRNMVAQYIAQK